MRSCCENIHASYQASYLLTFSHSQLPPSATRRLTGGRRSAEWILRILCCRSRGGAVGEKRREPTASLLGSGLARHNRTGVLLSPLLPEPDLFAEIGH